MRDDAAKYRVLMIDDDTKLCRLVGEYLSPFGFDVAAKHTGPEGIAEISANDYDAVILDVMLPGIDGFEVLKQIRPISEVPVLMLTALGDEADRIVGLEIGADDYLPKTFSTRELLARLRAVTRRARAGSNAKSDLVIKVGRLILSPDRRSALLDGVPVQLTALEFDLLYFLATSAGRVFNRDQILEAIAGRDYDAFDRSIDVHVSMIRKKLGDDPKAPVYIKTVRSIGYMMADGEAR